MNRWLLIRRLRVPAFLVLFGILAFLNQWGVFGFRHSWPLFLILAGLLLLAERVALAPPVPPPGSYPAAGANPCTPVAAAGASSAADPVTSSGEASSPQPDETSGGRWRA